MIFITAAVILSGLFLFTLICQHVCAYLRDSKSLRRFPGMTWLAPFTNLPCMYYAARGQRYHAFHKAHERLGPVVRVGPNSVSFNDAAAVKDIYGHGSPVCKGEFYDLLAGSHRHLADVKDREDHSRKRRVLAGAFSQAGLENWEYIVADRTAALVLQLDRMCEKPTYHATLHAEPTLSHKDLEGYINYRHWMVLFAQDAIAQIGLSADLHLIEAGHDMVSVPDEEGKQSRFSYREALWRSHRIQTSFVWSPKWFKRLCYLSCWHPYWADSTRYTKMCIQLVKHRLERYHAGEKLDDFFTYLLESKQGRANLYPMGELVAECSIMLNAGSDTTGIALTNVLYWLLKNPSTLQTLRRELDDVLGEDESVAPYDKVKHLPYLRACLDESMRLTPPNTMSVSRLTPAEGMEIMGHWIPGNTTVHCPPYTIHRNPAVFPEPEKFIPERWLTSNARDLQPHYITFSAGARGCIGRNITYLEQTVALASMVHRYDFGLCGQDWVLSQQEAFTCSPGDMPVRIRRRLAC